MALRRSGRFSVIVATLESMSKSRSAYSGMKNLLGRSLQSTAVSCERQASKALDRSAEKQKISIAAVSPILLIPQAFQTRGTSLIKPVVGLAGLGVLGAI